jgi:hypothetical protein
MVMLFYQMREPISNKTSDEVSASRTRRPVLAPLCHSGFLFLRAGISDSEWKSGSRPETHFMKNVFIFKTELLSRPFYHIQFVPA